MLFCDWNETCVQATLACPNCNGVMGLVQTMDGALFVCATCQDEMPTINVETISE